MIESIFIKPSGNSLIEYFSVDAGTNVINQLT